MVVEAYDMDKVCGEYPYAVAGCAHVDTGIIVVGAWLTPEQKKCVLSHEQKHMAGLDHDRRPTFVMEC